MGPHYTVDQGVLSARFIANIEEPFDQNGTVVFLIDNRDVASLAIGGFSTGLFEDTVSAGLSLVGSSDVLFLRVRITIGGSQWTSQRTAIPIRP